MKRPDDSIADLFKRSQPPEISSEEWEQTLGSVLQKRFVPAEALRSRKTFRAMAFAATFVFGLATGLIASRLSNGNPVPEVESQTPHVERSEAIWDSEASVEEGTKQLCGLRSIEIERLERSSSDRVPMYQMTALTPSGAKVVWTYRGLTP